jgi:biotin carboxylase
MEAETIAQQLFDYQERQGVAKPMVLVKASAGGGGMGIDEVHSMNRFRQTYRRIRNYSQRQFNDPGVLIEQRIFNYNHLEVQIVSARGGDNPVHFGTRNCSVQSPAGRSASRPHQDSPRKASPTASTPGKSWTTSCGTPCPSRAKSSTTTSAPGNGSSPPRASPSHGSQHAHPGGERSFGRHRPHQRPAGRQPDPEQIRLGLGEPMGYTQQDVSFDGVGIEYRIIAEDTQNRFAPWTGRIEKIAWRDEPWLKLHTHVPQDRPYQIPTEYDPNLALAIVWGKDLEEAKARGAAFLDDFVLTGVDAQGLELKSNIAFLREKTQDLLEF